MKKLQRLNSLVVLLLLGLGFPPKLWAEEPLTLNEAIQIAFQNNPELKSKQAALEVAQGEKQRLSAPLLSSPRIGVQGATDAAFSNDGEYQFEAGVSQEFEIGGQRGLRKQIGSLELEKAKKDLEWFQYRLVLEVKQAFYQLLYLQQKKQILEDIAASNKELAQFALERQKQGSITPFEGDLWRLEDVDSFSDLFNTSAERNEALLNLKKILGEESTDIKRVLASWSKEFLLPSEEQLLEIAFSGRADLQRMQLDAQQKEKAYQLAKRSRIPNPDFSFGFMRDKSVFLGNDFTGDSAVVGKITSAQNTDQLFRFGLSFPLNIFAGKKGEIAKAAADRKITGYEKEVLQKQISKDIKDFRQRLILAKEIVLHYQASAANLDKNIKLLKEAYQKGNVDVASYLNYRDRLIKAKLKFLEARWSLTQNLISLELASGKPWGETHE